MSEDKLSRQQHSIYLLNIDQKSESIDSNIDDIIKNYNECLGKDEKGLRYIKEEVKEEVIRMAKGRGYNIRFYYQINTDYNPMRDYLQTFLPEKSLIITKKLVKASTITFIWNNKYAFAITTGFARYVISNYCVNGFGLKLFRKFKNSFKVASRTNLPMSGNVHSRKETYNQLLKSSQTDRLFELGKDVVALSDDKDLISSIFRNVNGGAIKNSIRVQLKDYLKLSSGFSLPELFQLLDNIQFIAGDLVSLRSDDGIVEIRDKTIINKCKEELEKLIWSADNDSMFAIIPKDSTRFLSAKTYEFKLPKPEKKEDRIQLSEVRDAYRKNNINGPILDVMIRYYLDENEKREVSLYNMLNGDFVLEGKKYFIKYGVLYSIEKNYMDRINDYIDGLSRQNNLYRDYDELHIDDVSAISSEDKYNDACAKHNKVFELHKKKIYQVEIADLLIVRDDELVFVHVKRTEKNTFLGGNCMRNLAAQIEASLSVLNNAANNSSNIEELYKLIKEQNKEKRVFKDQDHFETVLRSRRRIIIAAILPNDLKNEEEYKSKIVEQTKSTTAKMLVHELKATCTAGNADFYMHAVKVAPKTNRKASTN